MTHSTGRPARAAVTALLVLAGTSLIPAALAGTASAAVTSDSHGPVVAVEGPDNTLDLYWQADGMPYSPGQWNLTGLNVPYATSSGVGFAQVAGLGTTFSTPSVATDKDSTVIAVQGVNHSLDFYWAPNSYWSSGKPSFTEETVAGADTTYSIPSLVVSGNRVDIVATGFDNTLDFYSAPNGQPFSPKERPDVIGGPRSTWSAPTMTANGYSLDIAALGYDEQLDFYSDSVAYGPAVFGPAVVVDPRDYFDNLSMPSITSDGKSSTIVVQGVRDSLSIWSNWDGSGTWYYGPGRFTSSGAWISLPGTYALGQIDSAPQAVWSQGQLSIAAEGPGGSTSYYWEDATGLHDEQALDNGTTAVAPTITPDDGGMNIETQDPDGDVYFSWLHPLQLLLAPSWSQEQWSQTNCTAEVCSQSM
jgi:hypothetical protein